MSKWDWRIWDGGWAFNVFMWFLLIFGTLLLLSLVVLHGCAEIADDIDDIRKIWGD